MAQERVRTFRLQLYLNSGMALVVSTSHTTCPRSSRGPGLSDCRLCGASPPGLLLRLLPGGPPPRPLAPLLAPAADAPRPAPSAALPATGSGSSRLPTLADGLSAGLSPAAPQLLPLALGLLSAEPEPAMLVQMLLSRSKDWLLLPPLPLWLAPLPLPPCWLSFLRVRALARCCLPTTLTISSSRMADLREPRGGGAWVRCVYGGSPARTGDCCRVCKVRRVHRVGGGRGREGQRLA